MVQNHIDYYKLFIQYNRLFHNELVLLDLSQ